MKITTKTVAALSILLGAIIWLGAERMPAGNPLVGAWKLAGLESRPADGGVDYPYGRNPSGVIMYDAGGRMSVHLVDPDRPKFAGNDLRRGTPDDVQKAFNSYMGYFGTYTYDAKAQTVTHHLESCSYPNWTGTDQKRQITLKGDRLTLSTPPFLRDGKQVTVDVHWVRLK
jgi:hypothetical protein